MFIYSLAVVFGVGNLGKFGFNFGIHQFSLLSEMRSRGGHVKHVSRGDPMTTSQYSSSPSTREKIPSNMRSVNEMSGIPLNVSKSRKRPAAAVANPERSLKGRQLVIDTPLQATSHQGQPSSIQAQLPLLLDDAEPPNCGSQRSILRQPCDEVGNRFRK